MKELQIENQTSQRKPRVLKISSMLKKLVSRIRQITRQHVVNVSLRIIGFPGYVRMEMRRSCPERLVSLEKAVQKFQRRLPSIPAIFLFVIDSPFLIQSQSTQRQNILRDKSQQKENQKTLKEVAFQFKNIRNDGRKQLLKLFQFLVGKRKAKILGLPKSENQPIRRKENFSIYRKLRITFSYNRTQESQQNDKKDVVVGYVIQVVNKRIAIQNVIYYDRKVVANQLRDQNQSLTKKTKSIGMIIFILGPYAQFFYQLIFRFIVYKDRKVDDEGTDPQQFVFYLAVIVTQIIQHDKKVKNRQKEKMLLQAKEDKYKKENNLQTKEDEEREKRFMELEKKEKEKSKKKKM